MSSRVALVTGAAQGIGEAISFRLADEEVDVAILDIPSKKDQLQEVSKQIEAKGRRCLMIVGDVTVEEDVKTAIDKTVQDLGGLDIVSKDVLSLRYKFIDIGDFRWSRMRVSCCIGHSSKVCFKCIFSCSCSRLSAS